VQSPIKLKVTLPYVDKTNCTKKYAEGNIKLSPSQICAGGMKAKDSCSGGLLRSFIMAHKYIYNMFPQIPEVH
jgi:hypothetical protein